MIPNSYKIATKVFMRGQGFIIDDDYIESVAQDLQPLMNGLHYSILYYGVLVRLIKENVESHWGSHLNSCKHRNDFEKCMFNYLKSAERCFITDNILAGIMLCRSTLEMSLRSKLLLSYRQRKGMPKKQIAKEEEFISNLMFGQLIQYASGKPINKRINPTGAIISFTDINSRFVSIQHNGQPGRKLLDKFIHGDFSYLQAFIEKTKKKRLGRTRRQSRYIAMDTTIIPAFLMQDVLKAVYATLIYLI